MDYLYTQLPCGLRVVHRPMNTAVSYCGFIVNTGTRNEGGEQEFGMAHFIEHMLFKGTTHRNSWQIANRIESVGGELNAFTSKEDTTYYSAFLHEDFDRACELLCDLLCHSSIPDHELEKEKEVVIDEIMCYRDNPAELIYDIFEDRLFEGGPLGHNILGNEATVRQFRSADCLQFIGQHYRTEDIVFFSQGQTDWKHILHCLEKWWDKPMAGTSMPVIGKADGTPALLPIQAQDFRVKNDTSQTHVMIGSGSYAWGSAMAPALALVSNMLAGPGMNSLLNQDLREKRGLVYTVESSITNYTDTGVFSIYFGCDADDRDHCLQLVHKQLQHLRTAELTTSKLHAAQKQFKGQLGVGTANLENMAINLGKSILRSGRSRTLGEICAQIDQVTAEGVMRAANEVLADDRLLLVTIE